MEYSFLGEGFWYFLCTASSVGGLNLGFECQGFRFWVRAGAKGYGVGFIVLVSNKGNDLVCKVGM